MPNNPIVPRIHIETNITGSIDTNARLLEPYFFQNIISRITKEKIIVKIVEFT